LLGKRGWPLLLEFPGHENFGFAPEKLLLILGLPCTGVAWSMSPADPNAS
jgi:hypothetical protein